MLFSHDTHRSTFRSRPASRLVHVCLAGAFEGHASGEDGLSVRLGAVPGNPGEGVAVDAPRREAGSSLVGRGFDVQGSGGGQDQGRSFGRGSGGSVPPSRAGGAVSGTESGHGSGREDHPQVPQGSGEAGRHGPGVRGDGGDRPGEGVRDEGRLHDRRQRGGGSGAATEEGGAGDDRRGRQAPMEAFEAAAEGPRRAVDEEGLEVVLRLQAPCGGGREAQADPRGLGWSMSSDRSATT